MPVVVSDTSPIRALDHLGLLDVLGKVFGHVIVPPAVLQELERPRPRFRAVRVSGCSFIKVRAPSDQVRVQAFCEFLDLGESEALVVTLEIGAEALLIDESSGRAIAESYGVPVIGTLGILARAKTRGYVREIAPLLDRLRDELDFFIGGRLREEFLRQVGE